MKLNRLTFLSLCVALGTLSWASVALTGDEKSRSYYIYVTAESEDEVAVVRFDGRKAAAVKTIQVGVRATEIEGPHGITISPDGKHWYLSMAHGIPFGQVYKYTTGEDRLVGRVELGLFPATMQVSPTTGLLYVVNFNLHGDPVPSSVSVVEPETMAEVARITTGPMPHGSRLSRDGRRHYSVAMMSGDLFEIDALAFEVRRRLYVGATQRGQGMMPKPTWVQPHPDGRRIYVACNGSNEVMEVDINHWKILRRFPTARGPYNLDVTPDGERLVVTYKSAGSTGFWDLKTGQELARIPNSREVPHGIAIAPDGRYAFISVEGKGGQPGAMDVFELGELRRVAVAEVGRQAGGIAFWKMVEETP